MGAAEYVAVAVFAMGAVFGVIGWLLNHKDQQQEREIAEIKKTIDGNSQERRESIKRLFELHQEDAKRLVDVEIHLAKNHYDKMELDARFGRLEDAVNKGFEGIHAAIKSLSVELRECKDSNCHHRERQ